MKKLDEILDFLKKTYEFDIDAALAEHDEELLKEYGEYLHKIHWKAFKRPSSRERDKFLRTRGEHDAPAR